MLRFCSHHDLIRTVTPSALGCEECIKTGSWWVHLRICRSCGHVGCCDQSPGKHATKHFKTSGHPIIEGYDPPEGWGWCYVDETFIELDRSHAAARSDTAVRTMKVMLSKSRILRKQPTFSDDSSMRDVTEANCIHLPVSHRCSHG